MMDVATALCNKCLQDLEMFRHESDNFASTLRKHMIQDHIGT